MMMREKILILSCMLVLLVPCLTWAQTTTTQTTPGTTTTPATPTQPTGPVPDPYETGEFPVWLLDLRRAEIIFFGSLPFTFLIAVEGVEVGRYFVHGQDPNYAPFPFRSGTPVAYTLEEKLLIIGSAVAISLTVALIDFIIQKAKPRPVKPAALEAPETPAAPETPETPAAPEAPEQQEQQQADGS